MDDQPTTEEQLQNVAAAYNILVRKNRVLVEKLAASEDASADMQARAESQIEALQTALKEATEEAAPQQAEVITPDEVIDSPLPS